MLCMCMNPSTELTKDKETFDLAKSLVMGVVHTAPSKKCMCHVIFIFVLSPVQSRNYTK